MTEGSATQGSATQSPVIPAATPGPPAATPAATPTGDTTEHLPEDPAEHLAGQSAADPAALGRPARLAWRPVLAVTAAAVAVHLAVATRYGWFGDEFYYVICGRHPAWGYVDQPPLAPMLARLAAAIPLDGGLLPLRVLAIAAQAGCIVLAAVLAAELGGRRRAQGIAAAAVAGCPVFVGGALLFGTTVLDQLAWAALFVLVARALRLGTTRAWLWAGLVAGIGLENKDTVAVLLVGIAVGLALYRPEVLRTRGPWLAAGLALLLALPNLIWDASHGWPNLSMDKALSREQGGPLGALLQLPQLPLILGGLFLIGLWRIGLRQLRARPQHGDRWIPTVAIVAVVLFTLGGGKPYYPAPAVLGLFAAGAVRVERFDTHRGRRAWPVLLGASAVTSTLLLLPVLPVGFANAERGLNSDLMQTYGWPQFVAQAAEAAAPLPAGAPIFTSDYEEAGALTILGPAAGIDRPIYSGHNNYTLWGPPPGRSQTVLVIGAYTSAQLQQLCASSSEIAPYTLPDGLTNNDIARHVAFYLCQGPRGTWAQLWPQLKHFD
jgi:Dolichyl-phosphate-mannose-protein mannosyltransferase